MHTYIHIYTYIYTYIHTCIHICPSAAVRNCRETQNGFITKREKLWKDGVMIYEIDDTVGKDM